jgi:hypothetical protein
VGYQLPHQAKESARKDSNLRPRGSKPLTLTRLRYSPKMVAKLTTRTPPAWREREDPSSESKHNDTPPRTSSDLHASNTSCQHHLLSAGDGSVSRTHHELLMRQLLFPLSYPALGAPTRSRTSRLRHRKPVLCPAELWTRVKMWKPRQGSNLLPPGSKPGALSG